MHEIITLQLGQRANYLATHYWNTQESYHTFPPAPPSPIDHDISFRPGLGADGGETYLPRTVIYDLKGGFGSLKKVNDLYEIDGGGGGVWDGPQTIQTAPPIPPSPYIESLNAGLPPPRLTPSTVRYWSDFSHVYYHPRSIIQLNDYSLGSSLQPFENYSSGDELFDSLDKEHDLLDRDLRLWAEECDQMQGIQVFTATDDAWGGFAGRYVERIRDEYGKVALWMWGIEGGNGEARKEKQTLRTVNSARAMHDISSHASLYFPISSTLSRLPEYVSFERTSQWHTSALLSVALESVTLPTRLRAGESKNTTFSDMEAALNVNGNQRIAQLQCTVLNPNDSQNEHEEQRDISQHDDRMQGVTMRHVLHGEDEVDQDSANMQDLDINLFPEDRPAGTIQNGRSHKGDRVFGQIETFRGRGQIVNQSSDTAEEGYARKRRRIAGLTLVERYHSPLPYPLLDTFPPIFQSFSTKSVAMRSSLSTSARVADRVKALRKAVLRIPGLEEREELSNGLGEIAEAYEEGWDSGSDEGSDE